LEPCSEPLEFYSPYFLWSEAGPAANDSANCDSCIPWNLMLCSCRTCVIKIIHPA
jgi:hypothetical protein